MFLAHLDRVSGGLEPRFLPVPSTRPGLKGVTVMAYHDVPEAGCLTAITYGLSLAEHPGWHLSRPELCISVRSADESWALAAGYLAERLRGDCPFSYRNTIGFGEPVCAESALSSFVVAAPAVPGRDDFTGICLGDGDHVSIADLYPIYDSERAYIQEHGLEAFCELNRDPCDVHRPPAA
jgi:hypothetical protein